MITAGPTREPLDPVRYITNASSGRMGYALAAAARKKGACVTLISGPTALRLPRRVRIVPVFTAREMLAATLRWCRGADVMMGAAAVADWAPTPMARQKLKKRARRTMIVRFKPNPDILASVARRRRDDRPRLIGFALETQSLMANARRKLEQKQLEMIVANPYSVLNKSSSSAILVHRSGATERFAGISKAALAGRILDFFARHFA